MRSWTAWPLSARLGVAAILGGVAVFGLAPWGLWPVTLAVLLVVPALFVSASSTRHAALIGWALGAGWFGHGLAWIGEPFLVDEEHFGWMAPFAIGLMAAGGGLFWALAFGVAYRLGRSDAMRVFALILTWSLVEFARAYLLTGFPWAALAQIWPGSDAALLLAWIGPHGLALLTLLATLLPGLALIRPGDWRARLASLAPALILLGASLTLAQARPEVAPLSDNIIRMVQPNAPQHQKWDPAYVRMFFERQVKFTGAGNGPRPDLIVWPETAVPTLLGHATLELAIIARAAAGVPVVLGIQREEEGRYYNSLIYLDETGQVAGIYDKHHLVPFGEYMPFPELMEWLGLRGLALQIGGGGYTAGPGPEVMRLGDLGKALLLICYEAIFPQGVGGVDERADFLLKITNDAWFGTRSGPYQHLAQAQMRAVEQGLPMIRSANTGVSAMIDPWGRNIAELALGQAGFIDAPLPAPLAPTLYARTGDRPVFLLLLIAAFGLWWLQIRRTSEISN